MAMYSKLISSYPELKASSRLAIISLYRYQVSLLREKFRSSFGVESAKLVDINTVDGFQGREKEVAIFSYVKANKDGGIGFVSDFRRMNVGITRARSSVLVVGSASTLRGDGHWRNLIESAEQRSVLFKAVSSDLSCFQKWKIITTQTPTFSLWGLPFYAQPTTLLNLRAEKKQDKSSETEVSKPYAEFFSKNSLESMRVKVAMAPESPVVEMDLDVGVDAAAAVEPEDNYGEDGGHGN